MRGRQEAPRWLAAGAILGGFALLLAYVLRQILDPGNDRLPGIDSGNLYIWENYTRSVLGSGRLPHWNPYHFAGTPHLADIQTTVLYPVALVLRVLPPVTFLGWMAAVHVWIGAAGALFLGRTVGLGWGAAAAVGLAVMLGGSFGAWMHNGHLLLVYGASWLPWAIALSILSVRRTSVLPHPGLVAVLALQLLAGYLQGSLYVVAAVSGYFLLSVAWPESGPARAPRWRPIVQLGALAVLTFGLTAFQLLPTATLVTAAGRTGGVPYEVAIQDAWAFDDLARFFFPFHGVSVEPPFRQLSDAVAYVGWLLAALVPLAFTDGPRRRIVIFFTLVAAAAVGLALGDSLPLYRVFHQLFPGLRVPGRALFLATLSVAVLGGVGLERLIVIARTRNWRQLAGPGAVSLAAVVASAAVALALREPAGPAPSAAWPVFPWILAAGIVSVAAIAVSRPRAALATALLFVAADLTTHTAGAVHTVGVESDDRIGQWIGPPDDGRAVSVCENLIGPGEMLRNRQPTLDGLASLMLDGYVDWAYIAASGDPPAGDNLFHRVGSTGSFPARRDLLDLANVTTIFACEPLAYPFLAPRSQSGSVRVYRTASPWPRAIWTCSALNLPRAIVVSRLVNGRYDDNRRLERRHHVNIRWAADTADARRRELADRYGLREGVEQEGDTWEYVLDEMTTGNLLGLIQDPAVEDTHGVDRRTGMVVDAVVDAGEGPIRRELLIGTRPCQVQGDVKVLVKDRPDGLVVLEVDAPEPGLVFLSESYYRERKAFVDGQLVTPLKANMTFTAVPVAAGRHRVELRHVPASFHVGLGMTGVTLAAWIGLSLKR